MTNKSSSLVHSAGDRQEDVIKRVVIKQPSVRQQHRRYSLRLLLSRFSRHLILILLSQCNLNNVSDRQTVYGLFAVATSECERRHSVSARRRERERETHTETQTDRQRN